MLCCLGVLSAEDTLKIETLDAESETPKHSSKETVTHTETYTYRTGSRAWWDREESKFPPWERGVLRVGGFVASFDTAITFGVTGAGISINAEELLGLESTLTVYRFDGLWRFGQRKRHTFDFSYAA